MDSHQLIDLDADVVCDILSVWTDNPAEMLAALKASRLDKQEISKAVFGDIVKPIKMTLDIKEGSESPQWLE